MRFIFLIVLSLFSSWQLSAQQSIPVSKNQYDYVVTFKNVETRNDVRFIENKIRKIPGVISFESNRFPVRYFILRTRNPFTKERLAICLNNSRYTIELYGQGDKTRETAIVQFNKQKAGR